jgi:hypothetical protein
MFSTTCDSALITSIAITWRKKEKEKAQGPSQASKVGGGGQ